MPAVWGVCLMFTCDDCGKERKGSPYGVATNPWDGIVEHQVCFPCAKTLERKARKQELEWQDAQGVIAVKP